MLLNPVQQFQSVIFAGLLAVLPALFWFIFYYFYLAKSKSGFKYLALQLFLVGMVTAVFAYYLETLLSQLFGFVGGSKILQQQFYSASEFAIPALIAFVASFLFVAPIEELTKYLGIKLFLFESLKFDSVIDMIRGGAAVGLGFATMENIFYFTGALGTLGSSSAVLELFFLRFFISTFAQTIYSALMGYWLGLARIHATYRQQFIRYGLLVAIILHGAFNFFLIVNLGFVSVVIVAMASLLMFQWFAMRINFLPLEEARNALLPLFASKHETEALLYMGGLKHGQAQKLAFCPFCLAKKKDLEQERCYNCGAKFR